MSKDVNELRSTPRRADGSEALVSKTGVTPNRRGAFVVVVGPDGVGKTTLAEGLLEARQGHYFHFRPPFRAKSMLSRPPHHDPPLSKDPGPTFPPVGWLRLARNFVSSWIGYLTAVRPATSRGALVVGDRWLFGYLVQPRPLRYGGPEWLARLAIALLPSPDLVVNLTAPVELIAALKEELSRSEIARELEAWKSLPVANLVTIDASSEIQDVTLAVLDYLPAERS